MAIETKTRSVQDVITYVERQFGDESSVQITTADVVRWINSAQREIAENNLHINATYASTDIVAQQDTYPLKTDPNLANINRIRSVRYQGDKVRPITFEEAESYVINSSQYPTNYGIPTVWWEDAGELHLYPTPLDSVTKGLTIHFTTVPKPVAAAGDLLDIPDSYFNSIVEFCMAQAYEQDENFQAASVKSSQFEKSLGILANRTETQDSTFPVITLDPEDAY